MKICKRIMALLLLLLLLPLPVAATGTVDMNRDTTLTVYAVHDSVALTGMMVELYQVASMDCGGELTVMASFRDYAGELDIQGENADAWQERARTLEQVVMNGGYAPDQTASVNAEGAAAFGNLAKGLYLVRADAVEVGAFVYTTAPFFVMLPQRNPATDDWNYQVEARAKATENDRLVNVSVTKIWKDSCVPAHEHGKITVYLWRGEELWDTQSLPQNGSWSYTWKNLEAKETWRVTEEPVAGYTQLEPIEQVGFDFTITNVCNQSSQTDVPDKLPQTGQLWWPVPVLLCGGLLCLVIGLARRRRDDP